MNKPRMAVSLVVMAMVGEAPNVGDRGWPGELGFVLFFGIETERQNWELPCLLYRHRRALAVKNGDGDHGTCPSPSWCRSQGVRARQR
jgi:hypothetical protein